MEHKTTTPSTKINWSALEEYFIFCFGGFEASKSMKNIICFTAELVLRHEENAGWMAQDFSEVNFFLQCVDKFARDNEKINWRELSEITKFPTKE